MLVQVGSAVPRRYFVEDCKHITCASRSFVSVDAHVRINIMLRTVATLFEYMKAHPDEQLEFCMDVRKSWWRMRPSFVKVHASAARGLMHKNLLMSCESNWRYKTYKLSNTD